MVTIKVGPGAEAFCVHEVLICASSTYFRSAFEGSFKEAETKILELPEVNPVVFHSFVGWLYNRKIRTVSKTGRQVILLERDCVRLYVFGEEFALPKLQNAVIAMYHQLVLVNSKSVDVVDDVYQNTREGSGLRKLIVIQYVQINSKTAINWKTCPQEFLADVAIASVGMLADRETRKQDIMTYWKDLDLSPFYSHVPEASNETRTSSAKT